uniref:TATA-binding protein-associated factor BTAF1 n=1 Tax=Tanacetum cinerariifolium TaxID=118510 RepID=A0A6L2N3P4_TANCI|nr:TATA-binding protein-associated factor BTAF1 [Tanacetum cinerariifolium]
MPMPMDVDNSTPDDAMSFVSKFPVLSNEGASGEDSVRKNSIDEVESIKQKLFTTFGYLKCVQASQLVSVLKSCGMPMPMPMDVDNSTPDDALSFVSKLPVLSNEGASREDSVRKNSIDEVESIKQRLFTTFGYLKCVQSSSVLQNVTVSSCSTSNIQEKTQLSRSRCMHSLREVKSLFKFLTETLQNFGTMPIFKRTLSQDLDLLEQHLTKDILSQTDCTTTLTNLITKFETAFNSEFKERMRKYTRFDSQSFKDALFCTMDSTQEDHSNPISTLNVDLLEVYLVVIQNTYSEKDDHNLETVSSKSVKESSLDSATNDVHAINYKMSKAKERCMTYSRSLHSHLQVLSKEDLKGTSIEHGFKRPFMSLFGQDANNFTNKYFTEYTGIKVKQFRDTLLQHMSNVNKSVAKRTRHQRQYDRRVNKRQMQTQESKIDMGKGIDAHSVVTESSGIESEVQDDNNRSGNDTDANDADIRPIYNEEPLTEVQLTAECNIFAIGQQHTEEPKIINEGRVDQKLKGSIVDTKFAKTSVLGKPVVQSPRNQSVVRQLDTFKSERQKISKQRFASRVDVNNNLSRPITQHYLSKRSESAFAEPDHLIASSESRNRFKNMPRFSSNDMVYIHYLNEARKKTEERDRN